MPKANRSKPGDGAGWQRIAIFVRSEQSLALVAFSTRGSVLLDRLVESGRHLPRNRLSLGIAQWAGNRVPLGRRGWLLGGNFPRSKTEPDDRGRYGHGQGKPPPQNDRAAHVAFLSLC